MTQEKPRFEDLRKKDEQVLERFLRLSKKKYCVIALRHMIAIKKPNWWRNR